MVTALDCQAKAFGVYWLGLEGAQARKLWKGNGLIREWVFQVINLLC